MKKITEQEFITRLKDVHGTKYIYTTGFINTNTKVELYCNRCNKTFKIKPHKLFIGQGCPHCRAARISEAKQFTQEEFEQKVLELLGPDYKVLSTYSGQSTKVKLLHTTCGTTFETTGHNIINKHRSCPICTKKRVKHSGFKYTNEEFLQKVKELVGDEYVVLDPYLNNKTKIRFKHIKCGTEFLMKPEKFIHAVERCPNCQHSRGEDIIFNFLKLQNKYTIVPQYKFDDLFYKSSSQKLRFDFALLDGTTIKYLIEFDGIQHYKITGYWNTKDNYKETKARDRLKNNYCKKHGYKLIRISYLQFKNIEKILKKKII